MDALCVYLADGMLPPDHKEASYMKRQLVPTILRDPIQAIFCSVASALRNPKDREEDTRGVARRGVQFPY